LLPAIWDPVTLQCTPPWAPASLQCICRLSSASSCQKQRAEAGRVQKRSEEGWQKRAGIVSATRMSIEAST
jgi:hypothetical protein